MLTRLSLGLIVRHSALGGVVGTGRGSSSSHICVLSGCALSFSLATGAYVLLWRRVTLW